MVGPRRLAVPMAALVLLGASPAVSLVAPDWRPDVPDAFRYAGQRQRWGIPKAAPDRWEVFFKGGWGSGTGAVTHQVAFLESGERRIAVAIFTESSLSHSYGTSTVLGVATRLLQGLG